MVSGGAFSLFDRGLASSVLALAGAAVSGFLDMDRPKDSGKVAWPCADGSVGRNSGPFCPQPDSVAMDAAQAARAMHLTRIWVAFNMGKL